MVNSPSPGFWNQWDIQTLHYPDFNLASGLSLVAILALEAVSPTKYEFTKWQEKNPNRYLGPIIASVASLVLVNSSSWLANLELEATTEMIIYSGIFILNAIIQIAGNWYYLPYLGLEVLGVLLFLGAFAVIPVVAMSNPLTIALIAFVYIAVTGPLLVDFAGTFLFAVVLIKVLILIFNTVNALETHPEAVYDSLQDLLKNGLSSSVLSEQEDDSKIYLGDTLENLIGTDTLRDILDNIGLHLGLHILIVLPLTIVLPLVKPLFVFLVLASSHDIGQWIGETAGKYVSYLTIAYSIYSFITDGGLGTLIDLFSSKLPVLRNYSFLLLFAKVLLHSFLTFETGYWGIYFFVRLILNWANGEYSSDQDSNIPVVTSSVFETIGEQAEGLVDYFNYEISSFQWKYVRDGIFDQLIPLVLVVTWSFQYPFFQGMLNHILALSEQA